MPLARASDMVGSKVKGVVETVREGRLGTAIQLPNIPATQRDTVVQPPFLPCSLNRRSVMVTGLIWTVRLVNAKM